MVPVRESADGGYCCKSQICDPKPGMETPEAQLCREWELVYAALRNDASVTAESEMKGFLARKISGRWVAAIR